MGDTRKGGGGVVCLIFGILWARPQPQVFLANVPCLAIIQNHSHATIWMIQGMVEHFARNEIDSVYRGKVNSPATTLSIFI